jgi:hypothetical protein
VDGVCADCWGIKDLDSALDLRPEPRTESLFDWGDWASSSASREPPFDRPGARAIR